MDKQHWSGQLAVSPEQGELRKYLGTVGTFSFSGWELQPSGQESRAALPARINSIAPPGPVTAAGACVSLQPPVSHAGPPGPLRAPRASQHIPPWPFDTSLEGRKELIEWKAKADPAPKSLFDYNHCCWLPATGGAAKRF